MKILVDIIIRCQSAREDFLPTLVGKEYSTELIPMVGMYIEDPVWEEPKKITGVTINPKESYYHIYVGEDVRSDEEMCKELENIYYAHGWDLYKVK
jgi:hypothetical protein